MFNLNIKNRFLNIDDCKDVLFRAIRKKFEYIYEQIFHGTPHTDNSKMHWCRDWEYPWIIINGEFREGQKVLDCGCGGSPLPIFLAYYGCESYGIDLYYGNYFRKPNILRWLKYTLLGKKEPLCNLRHFYRDPNVVLKKRVNNIKVNIIKGDMCKMPYEDDYFDRVCCVSTFEHMNMKDALQGLAEMVRVVKKGGLILLTIDHNGSHINKEMNNCFQTIINKSGCTLYGDHDWSIPSNNKNPDKHDVVAFILKKP